VVLAVAGGAPMHSVEDQRAGRVPSGWARSEASVGLASDAHISSRGTSRGDDSAADQAATAITVCPSGGGHNPIARVAAVVTERFDQALAVGASTRAIDPGRQRTNARAPWRSITTFCGPSTRTPTHSRVRSSQPASGAAFVTVAVNSPAVPPTQVVNHLAVHDLGGLAVAAGHRHLPRTHSGAATLILVGYKDRAGGQGQQFVAAGQEWIRAQRKCHRGAAQHDYADMARHENPPGCSSPIAPGADGPQLPALDPASQPDQCGRKRSVGE
jgi:hypothetical protein